MYHKDIDNLYVAWRKVLRKVWVLPYRTHCKLLPPITGLFPAKVMFYKRFITHFLAGLNNDNVMVSTVYRSALFNLTRLGNNIRHVCFQNDINVWNVGRYSVSQLGQIIINNWSESVEPDDERIGVQVKELCVERDSLNEWLLDRGEIEDIIEFLCLN